MSFAIAATSGLRVAGDKEFFLPANHKEIADVDYKATSTTGATQTLSAAANHFRVAIWGKTVTLGSGTAPTFFLEVADDSSFSTNVREIARVVGQAIDAAWSAEMKGSCPDGAKLYCRVNARIGTAWTALTADIMIDAAQ